MNEPLKSTLDITRPEPSPQFLREFEEPIQEAGAVGFIPIATAIYFLGIILIAILCS